MADRITQPLGLDKQTLFDLIDLRYSKEIPPGFADLPEKADYKKYGDGILWLELLEYAKTEKKAIIFVTSDNKYDWWVKDNHGKTISPRTELAAEMWMEAGVEFHLYNHQQFMNFSAMEPGDSPSAKTAKAAEELMRLQEKKETEKVAEAIISEIADRAVTEEINTAVLPDNPPTIPITLGSSIGAWEAYRNAIAHGHAISPSPYGNMEALLQAPKPNALGSSAVEWLRRNSPQTSASLFETIRKLERSRSAVDVLRDYATQTRRKNVLESLRSGSRAQARPTTTEIKSKGKPKKAAGKRAPKATDLGEISQAIASDKNLKGPIKRKGHPNGKKP